MFVFTTRQDNILLGERFVQLTQPAGNRIMEQAGYSNWVSPLAQHPVTVSKKPRLSMDHYQALDRLQRQPQSAFQPLSHKCKIPRQQDRWNETMCGKQQHCEEQLLPAHHRNLAELICTGHSDRVSRPLSLQTSQEQRLRKDAEGDYASISTTPELQDGKQPLLPGPGVCNRPVCLAHEHSVVITAIYIAPHNNASSTQRY